MVTAKTQCNRATGVCEDGHDHYQPEAQKNLKQIEIYVFTDPLCPLCWGIEPKLKKMLNEYSDYVKVRYFIMPDNSGARIRTHNQRTLSDLWDVTSTQTGMCCDGDFWYENTTIATEAPSLAIKAAEMQGRQYGVRFLRRLREALFLNKSDVSKDSILIHCAKEVGLDETEFKRDFKSDLASRALLCDVRTTQEMGVEDVPTMIFFNDCIEDAGVSISGLYNYNVYIDILSEVLGFIPQPKQQRDLISFVKHYAFVATAEIAEVFDLSSKEARSAMKQLQLQQKVECIPVKHGEFWKHINDAEG